LEWPVIFLLPTAVTTISFTSTTENAHQAKKNSNVKAGLNSDLVPAYWTMDIQKDSWCQYQQQQY